MERTAKQWATDGAPVQGWGERIPWDLHLRAWEAYAAKYGTRQSAVRMAERAGFHTAELDDFVPGWRDYCSKVTDLKQLLADAEALLNNWIACDDSPDPDGMLMIVQDETRAYLAERGK